MSVISDILDHTLLSEHIIRPSQYIFQITVYTVIIKIKEQVSFARGKGDVNLEKRDYIDEMKEIKIKFF